MRLGLDIVIIIIQSLVLLRINGLYEVGEVVRLLCTGVLHTSGPGVYTKYINIIL